MAKICQNGGSFHPEIYSNDEHIHFRDGCEEFEAIY